MTRTPVRRLILAGLTALSLLALPAPTRASDYLVASAVDAGGDHSCALTRGGEAYCWGNNGVGQLGDGTTAASNQAGPRKVIGGLYFESIVAGYESSCAVARGGEGYCWGDNEFGELGDGTTNPSGTSGPRPVIGGLRWKSIEIDELHACGITTRGAAYCWGDNVYGQLGDGTTGASLTSGPRPVIGGLRWKSIDVGWRFTCGITTRGAAYCWGFNGSGQLGDGTTGASLTSGPLPVIGGLRWERIDVGYDHACGITTRGAAYCWGGNAFGELGDGTTNASSTSGPRPVIGGLRFVSVSTGDNFTCGVTSRGGGHCWGGPNGTGKLGDGTLAPSGALGPRTVIGGMAFDAIVAGSEHACGLTRDGVYCWGYNGAGRLGDGTVADSGVSGPRRVIAGEA